jgi:hypothetical protein
MRHAQSVHNKIIDFKMLDLCSTNDDAANGNYTQCNGSDRQRADAHWREIIWFYLVHAVVNRPQA